MVRNLVLSVGLIFALSAPSAPGIDITGTWQVKIKSTSDGELHGEAGFVQYGNHLTGWLGPSKDDPIPITLQVKERQLTIWTHPQPGRNVVFRRCDVTIETDKMQGTIDGDKGTIEFVRTARESPPPVTYK
jgi:hypothetical protein